jgi:hypothetical protein
MSEPLKDEALCAAIETLLALVRSTDASRDAVLVVRRDGRAELGMVSIDGTHYDAGRKFDRAEGGGWTETSLRVGTGVSGA